MVLRRGSYVTLKRVLWYFEEGGVVLDTYLADIFTTAFIVRHLVNVMLGILFTGFSFTILVVTPIMCLVF